MRERKYVKFRVDMPDDTKFKIINMKPERDLIHYVWYRLVLLCGKVNLAGELYLSKNIPYTAKTLAIEFNRGVEQVELALDVLIGLEMVELTEHKVYYVKNFAKHQNIKAKEKTEADNKEVLESNKVQVVDNLQDEIHESENKSENQVNINEGENFAGSNAKDNFEMIKDITKDEIHDNKNNEPENQVTTDEVAITKMINLNDNIVMPLDREKGKKIRKKKKDNVINNTDEEDDESEICTLTSGEFLLGKGDKIISAWTF
ncbi:phage replisome organizer N-terminal domain-containing protein [Clostridium saccharoperbutylacetonicum]|uniref:phage replisome organizer N-terminal domain-containing protein n=1 Tax=Clostridium saccharoperbutylacetonicum TaxID=36745 RepID=UPI0039EACCAD